MSTSFIYYFYNIYNNKLLISNYSKKNNRGGHSAATIKKLFHPFYWTVITTGSDSVVASSLSVAMAVSVYVPAGTLVQTY